MRDDALARWLALREAADAAARSETVTRTVLDALSAYDSVRVVDLAAGTGANIRYLIDRLGGRRQHWLALDHSSILLTELLARMAAWASMRGYAVDRNTNGCMIRRYGVDCQVETQQTDLVTLPPRTAGGTPHLVTASALLDLVSEQWLHALAGWCRKARAAALFAITYNGRSSSSPPEPEDDLIVRLFNRHQRTDKGLGGPAAGPAAVGAAVRAFADAGFIVHSESSDWHVEPEQVALQRDLIDGWAAAAKEIAPEAAATIESWHKRRFQHVESGRSRLVVGHDDIGAWPAEATYF